MTRKHIRVNRAATAWLIRRFIDREAIFEFVEPEEVAGVQARTGAKGFDAPGATYAHQDAEGRCSFEAMVAEYCASDRVLARIARIVHGADLPGRLDAEPECAGLLAISAGFPLVTKDDHETVERAAFLYDSLYAALERKLCDARAATV